MISQIKSTVTLLKEKKPLILCLSNYVTMDFIANCLLALGAAPLMSESIEELEQLVAISQALYINIGTLNQAFLERAVFAAEVAKSLNKPIILDPVGAGASNFRTSAAMDLLLFARLIRGNASEIIALTGSKTANKGVETSDTVLKAINSAYALAKKSDRIIVISGPEDFITDGQQNKSLAFGSNLMPLVTGMGCAMTAVLSAFLTSSSNHFEAASQATAYFGLCGQSAAQQKKAPASFRQAFIDNLFHPDWDFFTRAAVGVR